MASGFSRKKLLAAAVAVLAIAGAVAAWKLLGGRDPIPFTQFTLSNGLRVILAEDHSAPTVAVAVTYDVGSKDDPPGRDGLAHLFEHMLFNGSLNVGKGEHQHLISRQGGSANGQAFTDQTHLWQTVPANQLDLALFLEADRMRSLRLDQARLDTERGTVLAERQTRVENAAYGRIYDTLYHLAYDVPQYKRTMMGSREGLEAVTLQEVNDFFRVYFSPNNAVLTISGDFDRGEARKKVENYFQHIPSQPPPPRIDLTEAPQTAERRQQLQDPFATAPLTFVAYKIPPGGTADSEALAVLNALLADGTSSRVHQKLIKERGLVNAVGPSLDIRRGPGLALIVLQPMAGKDDATMLKAFEDLVAEVRDKGVSDAEVIRGRTRVKLSRAVTLQQSAQRALLLNEYEMKFGGAANANKRAEWLDAVTAADVQRVAQQYLVPTARTIVTIVPGGGTPTFKAPQATASAPTVSAVERLNKAPISKEILRVSMPAAKESTLDNGVTLLVAEDKRVPLVAVRFEIRGAGTLGHPAGKTAVPLIAGAMLREGTATRTSRQIAETLDAEGATLTIGQAVDPTLITVQATGLSDTFAAWFPVVADLVANASFPADELTLMKRRIIVEWTARRTNAASSAAEWYDEVVYRSGATTRLVPAAVEPVTSDQLVAWHRERYVPQNTVLSIVGAIDEEQAQTIVREALGKWQRTSAGEPSVTIEPAPSSAAVYIVDRPGSVLTTLVVGVRTVDRAHQDHLALNVASRVLGGGPSSRLMIKLRDERGLTYSAQSQLLAYKHVGDWRSSTEINAARLGEGLDAFFGELRRISAEPVPEAELDDVKRSVVASFALTLEQLSQTVYYLSSRKVYGLSNDYWETYPERLMAVTSADAHQAAAKYLDMSKLQIVAVGDAKQLEPLLKPLGPVTIVR